MKGSTENLYNDCISATPIDFDWSEGYGETWELIYPDGLTREQWFQLADDHGWEYEAEDDDASDEDVIERIREKMLDESDFVTPMMNYYYPISLHRIDEGEAQFRVMQAGACVLVRLHDEIVLTLAGGGMDLSWDICGAYIAVGQLPPAHFAGDLPHMAGGSGCDPLVAEAAVKSCEVALGWANNNLEDAKRTLAWIKTEVA